MVRNKKINSKGQDVGYIRVSSLLQNEQRQLEGIELDRTFTDKVSGKDRNRPELEQCMKHLREGDTLHVHSIDRLARNLKDLETLVTDLVNRGVSVKFEKEQLLFAGENSPMNTLMLQMMGAFAQFELSMIKERQREGIALAKKKGKQIGRKAKLSKDDVDAVLTLLHKGVSKKDIAQEMGVSRPTFYAFLEKHNVELTVS